MNVTRPPVRSTVLRIARPVLLFSPAGVLQAPALLACRRPRAAFWCAEMIR